MKHIILTILHDSMDCETCGYDAEDGFTLEIDGNMVIDKTPLAHCYDGTRYSDHRPVEELGAYLAGHLQGFPSELHPLYAIEEFDEDYTNEDLVMQQRHEYPQKIKDFLATQDIVLDVREEDISDRYTYDSEE